MISEERLKQVFREAEEEAKLHGGVKARALKIKGTIDTVEGVMLALWDAGITALKAFKDGVACDCIVMDTTEELSNKLADIPENEETWKTIYTNIPECFLMRTTRRVPMQDTNNEAGYQLVSYCDFTSENGRKIANNLIKKLGL